MYISTDMSAIQFRHISACSLYAAHRMQEKNSVQHFDAMPAGNMHFNVAKRNKISPQKCTIFLQLEKVFDRIV